MSSDEKEKEENKYKKVDFNSYSWPEESTIDRPDTEGNGEIELHTYRYPCSTFITKGIVTFMHGNADYAGRYAYMA